MNLEILTTDFIEICEIILLLSLVIISLKINFSNQSSNDIFTNIIYLTCFSFIISLIYLLYGAADVAITEASIGACVGTVIYLLLYKVCYGSVGQITYQPHSEKKQRHLGIIIYFILITITIIFFLNDMPEFGSQSSPVNSYINTHYIQESGHEIGISAVVASVLASYRAFDTLGETFVIFTAGLAVWLILSSKKNIK